MSRTQDAKSAFKRATAAVRAIVVTAQLVHQAVTAPPIPLTRPAQPDVGRATPPISRSLDASTGVPSSGMDLETLVKQEAERKRGADRANRERAMDLSAYEHRPRVVEERRKER